MRCEPCDGFGHVLARPNPMRGEIALVPCPDCGGAGVVSCCEGTERHAGVAGVDAPPFGQIIPFRAHQRPMSGSPR